MTPAEDPRLEKVSAIALALAQTTREIHGRHAGFKVKKKVFLYYVDDHHGDGIVAINCKLPPGENTALIAAQPKHYYMPAYVGPRGWAGFRLDAGRIDWSEVTELIKTSYSLIADKKLAAALR